MILKSIAKGCLKAADNLFGTDYHIRFHNHAIGFHTPNYVFDKSKIAFIHLPKTGGTSLRSLLEKDHQSRFIGLEKHRPISKFCNPKEYSYITIVRDPIERVWSYYQMVLRSRSNYPYKKFAEGGLEKFLRHCWEARDMACRYYSGEIGKEPCGKTLYAAMKNLNCFRYVINFNDFENEIPSLLSKLSIPDIAIPHERKSNYKSMNENERDLILKYNRFDEELYKNWRRKTCT